MDARDKVYSVLGMTNQRMRGTLQPDYTLSVSQVFTMAIVTDIKYAGNLECLNLVDHCSITPSQMLPSWVADLQKVDGTLRITQHAPKSRPYISAAKLNPITFSDDLHILHADGLFIDVVEDTCVQQTDAALRPLPLSDEDRWTWDIEKMTARLAAEGGISNSNQDGWLNLPEDLARSVERAIYDVTIAGQVFVVPEWIQYDVRYPDEKLSNSEDGDFQRNHLSGKAPDNEQAPKLLHGSVAKPIAWKKLLGHASYQTVGRTLILSKKRYLALASKATQPGDQIFVLFGLHEPAILRPQDDGTFKFVGTAYVHGLMKGEALNGWLHKFRQQRVSIR
jgi:hypothetical protein